MLREASLSHHPIDIRMQTQTGAIFPSHFTLISVIAPIISIRRSPRRSPSSKLIRTSYRPRKATHLDARSSNLVCLDHKHSYHSSIPIETNTFNPNPKNPSWPSLAPREQNNNQVVNKYEEDSVVAVLSPAKAVGSQNIIPKPSTSHNIQAASSAPTTTIVSDNPGWK